MDEIDRLMDEAAKLRDRACAIAGSGRIQTWNVGLIRQAIERWDRCLGLVSGGQRRAGILFQKANALRCIARYGDAFAVALEAYRTLERTPPGKHLAGAHVLLTHIAIESGDDDQRTKAAAALVDTLERLHPLGSAGPRLVTEWTQICTDVGLTVSDEEADAVHDALMSPCQETALMYDWDELGLALIDARAERATRFVSAGKIELGVKVWLRAYPAARELAEALGNFRALQAAVGALLEAAQLLARAGNEEMVNGVAEEVRGLVAALLRANPDAAPVRELHEAANRRLSTLMKFPRLTPDSEDTFKRAILAFKQLRSPAERRQFIEANPIVLDARFDLPFRAWIERQRDDHAAEGLSRTRKDLLRCRADGLDRAFVESETLRATVEGDPVMDAVMALVRATTLAEKRRIVEATPAMLEPAVVARLKGPPQAEALLKFHRELLDACRTHGIEAAFAARM